MKVILNTTVPKVGKEGQIVTVADGFARNYLFARGLAIVADKNQVAALERRQAKTAAKVAEGQSSAEAIKENIDGKSIRIAAKVGQDGGKLFGAVTAQDIADAIKTQLSQDLEKKKIALIEPIKRLGTFQIHVDLHRDVDAFVTLEVFDPEAIVEEPAPEPEA
jgi:large subunit ribosomal protein L9